MITDFENHTGEERFDDVVSQAHAIDLNQSQYVNVFGGTRLREALQRMEREDAELIDADLGQELCAREGLPIMVTGAVDQLGGGYQVSVELIVTATSHVARTERVDATSAGEFLAAVDDLSRRVRRHLGESLTRIEQRDEPPAKATTNSLEALRYFAVARRHINWGDNEGAKPFLNRALEADSTFASAWALMALVPLAQGEIALACGNPEKAVGYFRASLQLADNERTHDHLAAAYVALGEVDLALAEFNEIIRYPYAGFFDWNPIVWVQAVLGRADLHLQQGDRAAVENDLELLRSVQRQPDNDDYARKRLEDIESRARTMPRDGQGRNPRFCGKQSRRSRR